MFRGGFDDVVEGIVDREAVDAKYIMTMKEALSDATFASWGECGTDHEDEDPLGKKLN